MEIKPGEIFLGKYEILRCGLGEGASSKVHLARHIELDDLRALKIMRKGASGVGTGMINQYQKRFKLGRAAAVQTQAPQYCSGL